ncbi:hypothetical protein [Citrobacter freundii]|uniref:Uncharacterized protein n=1 Tax=Citrobacter freundii TaxID=546 RepID=A0A7G2INW2_CITFR|nr:hypothetical protein [Citrobacter freundii]
MISEMIQLTLFLYNKYRTMARKTLILLMQYTHFNFDISRF